MHHDIASILLANAVPIGGAALLVLLFACGILLVRGHRQRADAADRAAQADARLAELLRTQSEIQGRMAAMADVFGSSQANLTRTLNERLDSMSQRVSTTIRDQTQSTHENLVQLQKRLAVIDAAQNNIQTLAKDVVGLQAILSNKQTRGAFGQARMETIIADGLPMGAYSFQPTLSNGSRPDCIVHMPNGAPPLVIDAKFPLEAWNIIREAAGADTDRAAAQQFKRDMDVHIRDIAEKYLLQGETQDTAFLFVPSESIFAEIHEKFESIVQRAHRARIVIVSPSLLMLSIQVIQAVLKDQKMRAQAHVIQSEVASLMDDLGRLDERVRKLQGHFAMAQKDVDMIVTSADKLNRRGARIEALEFEGEQGKMDRHAEAAAAKPADGRGSLLKFRVVDED